MEREHTHNGRILTRRQLGAMFTAPLALAMGQRAEAGAFEADAAVVPDCIALPRQTEGPYFVDEGLRRSDLRSDPTSGAVKPGVPLDLRLLVSRVTETGACSPLAGAAVDIWHCDALGVYSDESNQSTSGETWMRGVQLTDSNGLARFRTIYPGHYVGRTTHIHVKVHTGGKVVHTGQFFFTDRLSKEVYRLSPYKRDTQSYQARATDQVYSGQHGSSSVLKLKRRGSSLRRSGLTGAITLGVAT